MPGGVQAPGMDVDALDLILKQRQASIRADIDEVDRLLATVSQRNARAKKLADDARAQLNIVLLDGSLSFHNHEKATDYVSAARKLAQEAAKLR
jgi:hypothetical protein